MVNYYSNIEKKYSINISGSIAHRGAYFGMGSGPIFLEQLSCSDDSSNLLQCARPPLGLHTCDHSQDAGVTCLGRVNMHDLNNMDRVVTGLIFFYSSDYNECLDSNGGCEQLCVNSISSFQCNCLDGFVLDVNGANCSGKL